MALINCPECNKEISDQGDKCPHCGYPIKQSKNKKSNIKARYIIIPMIIIFIVSSIIGSVYYLQILKPKNIYTEAINLLNVGKYDEANTLLNTIPDYKNVQQVKEELKYESYAYSAITNIKEILKNPESYIPYDIIFYTHLNEEKSKDNPVCIMHYGAQNGFGGNTTGYALFTYDTDTSKYSLVGTCDSLSESDYDSSDIEEIADLATCMLINEYKNNGVLVGNLDMQRIKVVLKNDAYSTIRIIE